MSNSDPLGASAKFHVAISGWSGKLALVLALYYVVRLCL
jgi:hypothetical protein